MTVGNNIPKHKNDKKTNVQLLLNNEGIHNSTIKSVKFRQPFNIEFSFYV